MIFSVQCAVGSPGNKPVTLLKYPSAPFLILINTGNNQYAMNDGGIWQLNYSPDDEPPTDDGLPITYSLRLKASNFGVSNYLKKIMYVYSVMTSKAGNGQYPEVSLQADEQEEFNCGAGMVSQKGIRTPVKCQCQGMYWTVGLDSSTPFTLLDLSVSYINRPLGVTNG